MKYLILLLLASNYAFSLLICGDSAVTLNYANRDELNSQLYNAINNKCVTEQDRKNLFHDLIHYSQSQVTDETLPIISNFLSINLGIDSALEFQTLYKYNDVKMGELNFSQLRELIRYAPEKITNHLYLFSNEKKLQLIELIDLYHAGYDRDALLSQFINEHPSKEVLDAITIAKLDINVPKVLETVCSYIYAKDEFIYEDISSMSLSSIEEISNELDTTVKEIKTEIKAFGADENVVCEGISISELLYDMKEDQLYYFRDDLQESLMSQNLTAQNAQNFVPVTYSKDSKLVNFEEVVFSMDLSIDEYCSKTPKFYNTLELRIYNTLNRYIREGFAIPNLIHQYTDKITGCKVKADIVALETKEEGIEFNEFVRGL
ncbi:MAG: hypothetical protein CME67_07320 [Halobacteriovoraceae bacterium]|nr:hypothetical protein [Halobacteriovoraceae bacterium]|tara:strand:- start:2572 stop:3699 length:1128 start_codon:yes stop_codon:yes gene_type:complete